MQDHYETLGIKRDATEDELRQAYIKLLTANHPDKNPDNAAKQDLTKKINAAYEILKDSDKRKIYDQEFLEQSTAKKPRPSSPAKPKVEVPPLMQAVLKDDVEGARLALKDGNYNSVYWEVYCCNPVGYYNALEMAIIRRCLPTVKLIVELNFNITSAHKQVMHGASMPRTNNTFIVAATYYKKEIFDYLIQKFNEQLADGGIDPQQPAVYQNKIKTKPDWFYLKYTFIHIVQHFKEVPFEVIEILKQRFGAFDQSVLDILFGRLAKPNDLFATAYIQRYGPGVFVNACIRGRRIADLEKLPSLGYALVLKDEEGCSPYVALADDLKKGEPPSITNETTGLFAFILKAQIAPTYTDFVNAAKVNTCLLKILLEWDMKKVHPLLEESQYIELFITMLKHHNFCTPNEKNIYLLLDEKYADFYKKVDKENNNFLHIAATLEKKLHPTHFLNFFENKLKEKYPGDEERRLAELMSSRNRPDNKLPHELEIKSDAVRKKFDTWKTYIIPPIRISQQPNSSTNYSNSAQHMFFNGAPQPLNPFVEIVTAIQIGDREIFNRALGNFTAENLSDPRIGHPLLAKAISLGRREFILQLLDRGCHIFLHQDNPYAQTLLILAPDFEILTLLKQCIEFIKNNTVCVKK